MSLIRYRAPLARAAGAAVLSAAALAAGLPGIAHADVGDRSVSITIDNQSTVRLTSTSSAVNEGRFTSKPPKVVESGTTAKRFGSISITDEGGTEGSATFSTKYGPVTLFWSHPYAGDDNYTCGDTPVELTCFSSNTGDPKDKVTFTITEP